jgi:microcystin-dependent protein
MSAEPYLGEIAIFPFNFAPENWMLCEGQKLPIQENVALFSVIKDSFGGDGKVNFALPDLRQQSKELGASYAIALRGVFPSKGR